MQLYCGTNSTYEAKGLTPVTHYFFRVQVNKNNILLKFDFFFKYFVLFLGN
jgi:hypothetical protein